VRKTSSIEDIWSDPAIIQVAIAAPPLRTTPW